MTLPDLGTNLQVLARWAHVLAGITWIGLLYFLNLVNVPFLKEIDAPVQDKVFTTMIPRTLWWFRWSAFVTWILGFVYYAWFCMNDGVGHAYLGIWLVVTLAFYGLVFFLIGPKAKLQKDGRVLAAVLAVVMIAYTAVVVVLNQKFPTPSGNLSSHVLYIGIGGGFGTFMFLNVWGIIWRIQKRLIGFRRARLENGTAVPAEAAGMARTAFLASRTNAWLSLPMLFLMVAAAHWTVIV